MTKAKAVTRPHYREIARLGRRIRTVGTREVTSPNVGRTSDNDSPLAQTALPTAPMRSAPPRRSRCRPPEGIEGCHCPRIGRRADNAHDQSPVGRARMLRFLSLSALLDPLPCCRLSLLKGTLATCSERRLDHDRRACSRPQPAVAPEVRDRRLRRRRRRPCPSPARRGGPG